MLKQKISVVGLEQDFQGFVEFIVCAIDGSANPEARRHVCLIPIVATIFHFFGKCTESVLQKLAWRILIFNS